MTARNQQDRCVENLYDNPVNIGISRNIGHKPVGSQIFLQWHNNCKIYKNKAEGSVDCWNPVNINNGIFHRHTIMGWLRELFTL